MTRRLLLLSLCALAACRSAQPIEGLGPARDTGGPRITFDLTRKPLPEMPFPNDLADRRRQADQFLPFYERSTRTLIARPVLPLAQEKRYAVILTDRVHDAQGRAVVPPGSGINHPAQSGELAPVLGRLPPGVRLQDIAYAWALTTHSTTRDLEAIQRGLPLLGHLAIIGARSPAAT